MSLEMWVVSGILLVMGATMLVRPETFAFWSIHRFLDLAGKHGVDLEVFV